MSLARRKLSLRKTYTDAEVWADPRSAAMFDWVNSNRKKLNMKPLVYGEPKSAGVIRIQLERLNSNKHWLMSVKRRSDRS